MAFEVYDYRHVNRNVLVTPEIRARLYHMQPGQVDRRHSHDLGHEVFLILEGKAEFTIEGHTEVLEAGQMCVALVDEIHQVRNLLEDRPTIMYLSVTPHIQPTHTGRTATDEKEPPQFAPSKNYHQEEEERSPHELLAIYVESAHSTAQAAWAHASQAEQIATTLQGREGEISTEAAVAARNAMWETLYTLHKQLVKMDDLWNRLAPTMAPTDR
jgi:quercetin dioxygenase-like cupin family protein